MGQLPGNEKKIMETILGLNVTIHFGLDHDLDLEF